VQSVLQLQQVPRVVRLGSTHSPNHCEAFCANPKASQGRSPGHVESCGGEVNIRHHCGSTDHVTASTSLLRVLANNVTDRLDSAHFSHIPLLSCSTWPTKANNEPLIRHSRPRHLYGNTLRARISTSWTRSKPKLLKAKMDGRIRRNNGHQRNCALWNYLQSSGTSCRLPSLRGNTVSSASCRPSVPHTKALHLTVLTLD
jgi:hypothetical protein